MRMNNYDYFDKQMIEFLEKIEITDRVKIETAKNGNLTARIEKNGRYLYIHSRYNPTEEAYNQIKGRKFEKNNIFVSGFGLGYHVREILRQTNKEQMLYILILDPELFKYSIENIDMEEIFNSKRLEFIFGENKEKLISNFKEKLGGVNEAEWEFFAHTPSIQTVPDKFSEIAEIIERIEINKKSLNLFRDIVMENIEENIEKIIVDFKIKDIKNIYRGMPFFIIAAGPSLDKNMEELKKIGERGIIIAVGTIARKLINRNKPDFIIVIDGLENVDKQLDGLYESGVPLIYFPTARYTAVENYKGKRICAFPEGDRLFEDINNITHTGFIKSGGSVATAACDLAKEMGAATIIFVGQDLAVSEEGYTHVSDTQFADNKKEVNGLRRVRGNLQEEVYTLKNLYIYLKWFENYIKDTADVKFINSTEGGAHIAGTKWMKLKNVIDLYCVEKIEKNIFDKILKPNYSDENRENIKNEINRVIEKRKK